MHRKPCGRRSEQVQYDQNRSVRHLIFLRAAVATAVAAVAAAAETPCARTVAAASGIPSLYPQEPTISRLEKMVAVGFGILHKSC